jgi:signal peptidase I
VESAGGAAPAARRPRVVAGLLSLFMPGLGQLYCDRPLRAVALVVSDVAVTAASLLAFVFIRSYPLNLAGPGLWVAFRVGVVMDAMVLARRVSGTFRPRWFASLPVQVVILVLYQAFGVMQIGLVLRDHAVEAFRVPTRSMSDTILPGDRFLVEKLSRFEPARGDVVVYWTAPEGEPQRFAHRVIGLPGERVEVRGSKAVVDGKELGEPYVRRDEEFPDRGHFGPVVVPAGHYFLLGDWRDRSRDSRQPEVGFVPREKIVARAMTVFFSDDPKTGEIRWRRIGHVIR